MTSGNETTRERFDRQVRLLGGEPAYEVWQGTQKPHRIICKDGHEGFPIPHNVQQGQGICRVCAGNDPKTAEKYFRERVTALGGKPAYKVWQGTQKPHRIICKDGHENFPIPHNVQQGRGICRTCAGKDPKTAEKEFRERVTALGGESAYEVWEGIHKPHRIICKEGHEGFPHPSSVQQGRGICRTCAGKEWDVFYITRNPHTHVIKFGITSGNSQARLSNHRADGFTEVLYVREQFTGAYELEQAVITGLTDAGHEAVQGREYFRDSALPLLKSMVPVWNKYGTPNVTQA